MNDLIVGLVLIAFVAVEMTFEILTSENREGILKILGFKGKKGKDKE